MNKNFSAVCLIAGNNRDNVTTGGNIKADHVVLIHNSLLNDFLAKDVTDNDVSIRELAGDVIDVHRIIE